MERSLLSYLYRTACKTSPFSTFTGVAAGRVRHRAGRTARPAGDPGRRRLEWPARALNVVVLARLAELVAADPARRADLPVALASGWKLDEDRVRYVQRAVTAGDDSARSASTPPRTGCSSCAAAARSTACWPASRTRPESCGTANSRAGSARRAPRRRRGGGALPHRPARTGHAPAARPRHRRARRRSAARLPAVAARARRDPGPTRLADAARRARRRPSHGTRPPTFPQRRALLTGLRDRTAGALQRHSGAEEPALPQTLLYEDVSAGTDRRRAGRVGPAGGRARCARSAGSCPPSTWRCRSASPSRASSWPGTAAAAAARTCCGWSTTSTRTSFDQYLQFTATKDASAGRRRPAPGGELAGHAGDHRARPGPGRADRAGCARSGTTLPCDAEELRLDDATVDAVAAELGPAATGLPAAEPLPAAGPQSEGRPARRAQRLLRRACFPFTRFTHCFDGPTDRARRRRRAGRGPGRADRDTLRSGSPRARSSPRSPRVPRPPTSICTAG